MNTNTLPRLPRHLMSGGASVAVRLPLEAGRVAHKPTSQRLNPDSKYDLRWDTFAACAPDDDPCREISAPWADHLGLQACTEDACWPDAEVR